MASKTKNEGAVVVRKLPKLKKGKPDRVVTSSMRTKLGFTSNTTLGTGGNFYSPELSPDFLELPQSQDEKRHYYRFFFRTNGYVHGAITFNTIMPLSKVRLQPAKAKDEELAKKATRFCEYWAEGIDLLRRLLEILHEINLLGEAYVFAEDDSPDMPQEVTHQLVREIPEGGGPHREYWQERPDANERAVEWLKDNYAGWTALRIIPPEQIHSRAFAFTDEKIVELIPDRDTKDIVNQAQMGDPDAVRIVESMPLKVVEAVVNGRNIPLGTDPDAGSFVYKISRTYSQYEASGISMVEPILRSLVYRDKLRQSQTSIASRHMTPYRIIYAENLNVEQVEALREQVDLALMDPDYSVITNFQVTWEERGADQRLLNLDGEYRIANEELYAGTGMTEGLLTGDTVYAGGRINLEVINQRFMLVRELLQKYVDKYLLKPMCARMGFVEEDEDGRLKVIHPRLSFTRLTIRDNQDTFDILFNLYQKGSLPVDTIYEHLNLDPSTVKEMLRKDMFTVEDSTFNELMRSIYSRGGDALVENSDVLEIIAEKQGWNYEPPKEEGGMGRFASAQPSVTQGQGGPVIQLTEEQLNAIVAKAVEAALNNKP